MVNLSLNELLAYATEEQGRWTQWFGEHGDAPLSFAAGGENLSTLGKMLLHSLGSQLWLVEAATGANHREWWKEEVRTSTAMLGLGSAAKQLLGTWLAGATDSDGARMVELPFPDQKRSVSARKIAVNALVHEIRHWAQIALIVRQNGMVPPGGHDIIMSRAFD